MDGKSKFRGKYGAGPVDREQVTSQVEEKWGKGMRKAIEDSCDRISKSWEDMVCVILTSLAKEQTILLVLDKKQAYKTPQNIT